MDRKFDLPSALEKRWQNSFGNFAEVEDHLPDATPDLLRDIALRVVPALEPSDRKLKRQNISDQKLLLQRQFVNRSELLMLHALCISYLRRTTQLEAKARQIFRMMWELETDFLLQNLTGRWIVSALQTFRDHGETEGERMAGAAGFLYGNLIKIYETERNTMREKPAEKMSPEIFKNKAIPDLFGFIPGDDILININAFVYGAAKQGGIASSPLLRLLEIVHQSNAIFSRIDSLVSLEQFAAHPAFTRSFEGRMD